MTSIERMKNRSEGGGREQKQNERTSGVDETIEVRVDNHGQVLLNDPEAKTDELL